MSHLLEAAVGCIDSSADDPKAFPLHLLAEQVILRKENSLMKSSEFPELFQIKQHEHSSPARMVEAGEVLKQIVAHVEELVDPVAIAAKDVGGDTMKPLALGQFDGAANHGSMSQFDVGIEKENVIALGLSRTQVAADGGHSAADDADVQPVAVPQRNFPSPVRRIGLCYQHSRTRHLLVSLFRQLRQLSTNQLR